MAHVMVSYKREDEPRVARLVRALRANGLEIRRRLAAADPTNAALQQLILRAMTRSARVYGSSVSWQEVAAQYLRIKQAHQLTPGDEKVALALHAHGFDVDR